jgi:hypothetical protein
MGFDLEVCNLIRRCGPNYFRAMANEMNFERGLDGYGKWLRKGRSRKRRNNIIIQSKDNGLWTMDQEEE